MAQEGIDGGSGRMRRAESHPKSQLAQVARMQTIPTKTMPGIQLANSAQETVIAEWSNRLDKWGKVWKKRSIRLIRNEWTHHGDDEKTIRLAGAPPWPRRRRMRASGDLMRTLDDTKSEPTMNVGMTGRNDCILKRRRLSGVVGLARIYADFGVKQLADAVGRDKTRIIPPTGNPKLDMVGALAGLLEWTVKDVVNALQGGSQPKHAIIERRLLGQRKRLEDLRRISSRLENDGRQMLSGTVSGLLFLHSKKGHERSIALKMIGRSQLQTGDANGALISFRNGLNQNGLDFVTQLTLKIDLCRAHMRLKHHFEARTIASDVLDMISDDTEHDPADFSEAERSARYIRGNAVRESIDHGVGTKDLVRARKDLLRSLQITQTGSNRDLDEGTVAVGAILELDTALGRITPEEAVHRIEETLRVANVGLEEGTLEDGTRRAWSWWCLFGARIAMRDHTLGPLWQKTHELARRAIEFGSGPGENLLREHAYLLLFRAWKDSRHRGAREISWHMEPMELKLFVNTMGAKNGFMEPGWMILMETGTLDRAKRMDPRTWRKGFVRV